MSENPSLFDYFDNALDAVEAGAAASISESGESYPDAPGTIPDQQGKDDRQTHSDDARTDQGDGEEEADTISFIEKAARVQEATRDYRNLLRPIQRMLSPPQGKGPAVTMCGFARAGEVAVHLVEKNGKHSASVTGVYRCGNGEACVFCAPRIAALRGERYRKVHEAVVKQEGRLLTLTLTLPHGPDDKLDALLTALKGANTGARAGGIWNRKIRRMLKAAGVLVDVHVRYSLSAGWHPHLHVTIPCLTDDEDAIQDGAALLVQRYTHLLSEKGYNAKIEHQPAVILSNGKDERRYAYPAFHHRPAEVEGDLSDGMEDDTSLSMFDVAQLAHEGDKKMEARFIEFAKAIRGTKCAVVTKPMAQALGIEPDPDDGSVLNAETKLGTLPSPVWSGLLNENLQGTFLSHVRTYRRHGWRYVWWWSHRKTGLAPPVLRRPAAELMVLFAARDRLADIDAKALAQEMIDSRVAGWAETRGATLAANTLDYAEAHYRFTKPDPKEVAEMVMGIEMWVDKLALRRRDVVLHTPMPMSAGDIHEAVPAG